ncbi:MAG: HupE/UreJ family protein [Komarekiella atlantica HA4396-MV6]|jgi:urease accessory protein|nr:HupE/UreJ family protein [Komarekiella atlantica HA4396-MV6]
MYKIPLSKSPNARDFTESKLERRHIGAIAALVLISLLSSLSETPDDHTISNCWEGFLWGMAEPVISLNCLTGIVAIGLLAAGVVRGGVMAACFGLAALSGMGIHLLQLNLPSVEIIIAILAIASGTMLVMPQHNFLILALLSITAGLFQGYAHAESIISIEVMPLLAYILGITFTQFAVFMSAREISNALGISRIRIAGFAFCTIGIVFLSNSIIY